MVVLSSRELRQNYDVGKIMLIRANFSPRDSAGNITQHLTKDQVQQYMDKLRDDEITQGYLWTTANLRPQTQVIKFTIVDTQQISGSPVTPDMQLLTMQDSFLISTLSYFLMNYTFSNGDQQNIDFTTGNSWLPITYITSWASHGTNPDLSAGCALFWIGASLNFTVNKKTLIPAWDCYRHYQAPMTQATPAFPAASSYIPLQENQHDGSIDGFYPMEPNIILGGGRGNDVGLKLAANIPGNIVPFNVAGYNTTFILKAVLCMRGILLQNSTNVK